MVLMLTPRSFFLLSLSGPDPNSAFPSICFTKALLHSAAKDLLLLEADILLHQQKQEPSRLPRGLRLQLWVALLPTLALLLIFLHASQWVSLHTTRHGVGQPLWLNWGDCHWCLAFPALPSNPRQRRCSAKKYLLSYLCMSRPGDRVTVYSALCPGWLCWVLHQQTR